MKSAGRRAPDTPAKPWATPRRRRARCTLALFAGTCLLMPGAVAGDEASLATCEAAFAAAPDAEGSSQCFYDVARKGGERELSHIGLRMEELLAGDPGNPWLTFYLGSLHWGQPEFAVRWFRQAAELFAAGGQVEGEVRSRMNLYRRLVESELLAEAAREQAPLAAIAESSGDPTLLAMSQVEQARYHLKQTEYDRAYALLQEAQPAALADDSSSLALAWLTLHATITTEVGRFEEALPFWRRLIVTAADLGDSANEANARYNEIRTLMMQAKTDEINEESRAAIRDLAEQALVVAKKSRRGEVEANLYLVLGMLSSEDKAKRYLGRCAEKARTPGVEASCLASLAEAMAPDDPDGARQALRHARELARDSSRWAQVNVEANQMWVSWEIDPPEQALVVSRRALSAIDHLSRQQREEETKTAVFSAWADQYYWLAGRLLEAGRPADLEQAFQVSELLRARVLRESIAAAQANTGDDERAFPALPAGLAAVQAALTEREALLSFLVALGHDWPGHPIGGSWLLVITSQAIRAYRLPDRGSLHRQVDIFVGSLPRGDGLGARLAAKLYDRLLGPALADLPPGIDRLILVPDDTLHRLPFAALRRAPGAEPLALRYRLSQVPSATLWRDWRGRRPAAARDLALALADPPLPRRTGAGPQAAVPLATTDRYGMPTAPQALPPLHHARREVAAMRRALGPGTLVLTGEEATEHFVKHKELQRFRIIHFAVHSLTDERHPEGSAVVLAGERGEDGLLKIAEIARLRLDGRVVVLASCSSGAGALVRGEGLLSLARGFFKAGAHTVVASLWRLPDEEAEELFTRFYAHLARGKSVAEALRAAQRDGIEAGVPASVWAGLVVLGDGDLVPFPGGRPWAARHARTLAASGLALALAVLLALGFLVRGRRQAAGRRQPPGVSGSPRSLPIRR